MFELRLPFSSGAGPEENGKQRCIAVVVLVTTAIQRLRYLIGSVVRIEMHGLAVEQPVQKGHVTLRQ